MDDKVILLRNDDQHKNVEVPLKLEHAQNLLKLQVAKKLKHYSLPKESPYIFKDGALILRTSKKDTGKTA